MTKKILITGATSGIGYEVAKILAGHGHHLLVHGRTADKVAALEHDLSSVSGAGPVEGYVADLSDLDAVEALATDVSEAHDALDVLINNAGVFKVPQPITESGHDVRFVVNTLTPFLLTRRLLPLLGSSARIINLSSAAQSPLNLEALAGRVRLGEFQAYAQSKLAITAWSRWLADTLPDGPAVVSVNPGSMLGTKMVRETFGVAGNDVRIGAELLERAALSDEFAEASGKYFDNDARRFASPHPDAADASTIDAIVEAVKAELAKAGHPTS